MLNINLLICHIETFGKDATCVFSEGSTHVIKARFTVSFITQASCAIRMFVRSLDDFIAGITKYKLREAGCICL